MKIFILLFISIFSLNRFAYETKGTLTFTQQAERFGAFAQANLRVYPIRQIIEDDIKVLAGKGFLDFFYVISVNSVNQNSNNPEVWDISLTLVPYKKISTTQLHIWSYKGLNIPIEIENYKQPHEGDLPKDFTIFQVDYSDSKVMLYLIVSLLVSLITILVLVVFLRNKKSPNEDIRDQWKKIILSSSEREDYEYIYKERSQWLPFFNSAEQDLIYNKISNINTCQYKKEWSDIDLHNVTDSFDDLKGIVEEKWV